MQRLKHIESTDCNYFLGFIVAILFSNHLGESINDDSFLLRLIFCRL